MKHFWHTCDIVVTHLWHACDTLVTYLWHTCDTLVITVHKVSKPVTSLSQPVTTFHNLSHRCYKLSQLSQPVTNISQPVTMLSGPVATLSHHCHNFPQRCHNVLLYSHSSDNSSWLHSNLQSLLGITNRFWTPIFHLFWCDNRLVVFSYNVSSRPLEFLILKRPSITRFHSGGILHLFCFIKQGLTSFLPSTMDFCSYSYKES